MITTARDSVRLGDTVVPTEAQLLDRARALIPMLRERAGEIELAGSVPDDVIDAMRAAGLFKIVQPRRWGGYGLDLLTFFRVVMEISRGGSSGSAAWVMLVLGAHQGGLSTPEAEHDVWGEDDTALISSSYVPAGSCRRVEGGYVVSGTWPTSSGCLNARWVTVGARGPDLAGNDDHLGFLVPIADGVCLDDWQSIGLRGTASRSIRFDQVFVPDHRVSSFSRSRGGLPFWVVATFAINSISIGFGQSAIDVCAEMLQGKKRSYGTGLLTDDPRTQERLGQAQAIVNSCRSRLESAYRTAVETVTAGDELTAETVANLFDVARTGQQIQQAVLSLYNLIGPAVVFKKYPFERVFRDTMAATVHPQARFEDEPLEMGRLILAHAAEQPAVTSQPTDQTPGSQIQ